MSEIERLFLRFRVACPGRYEVRCRRLRERSFIQVIDHAELQAFHW